MWCAVCHYGSAVTVFREGRVTAGERALGIRRPPRCPQCGTVAVRVVAADQTEIQKGPFEKSPFHKTEPKKQERND
jgi:hypothetical protein